MLESSVGSSLDSYNDSTSNFEPTVDSSGYLALLEKIKNRKFTAERTTVTWGQPESAVVASIPGLRASFAVTTADGVKGHGYLLVAHTQKFFHQFTVVTIAARAAQDEALLLDSVEHATVVGSGGAAL